MELDSGISQALGTVSEQSLMSCRIKSCLLLGTSFLVVSVQFSEEFRKKDSKIEVLSQFATELI